MLFIKQSYIKCWKSGDKYTCRVFSEKGKNLGTYKSKSRSSAHEKAKKRLKAVEFFKHQQDNYALTLLKLAKLYRKAGEHNSAKQLEKRARIRYYAKRLENG